MKSPQNRVLHSVLSERRIMPSIFLFLRTNKKISNKKYQGSAVLDSSFPSLPSPHPFPFLPSFLPFSLSLSFFLFPSLHSISGDVAHCHLLLIRSCQNTPSNMGQTKKLLFFTLCDLTFLLNYCN